MSKILVYINFETQVIKAVDITQRRFVGEYGFDSHADVNQQVVDEIMKVDYSIPFGDGNG